MLNKHSQEKTNVDLINGKIEILESKKMIDELTRILEVSNITISNFPCICYEDQGHNKGILIISEINKENVKKIKMKSLEVVTFRQLTKE